jgi:uncharacterized glyoxalase superfamily protein PhnB
MPMTGLVPSLMVEDVLRAVAFYHEVLGFDFVRGLTEGTRAEVVGTPSGHLVWALVRNGQARLAFATRSYLATAAPRLVNTKRGGSLVLDLECDDLNAVCERIGERAPFVRALHLTATGLRQCSIEDPDGYILTCSERVQTGAPHAETTT